MTHSAATDQQTLDYSRPLPNPERTIPTLAHAENLCRANRVRLTPIRRRVLEALYKAPRPLGAYDLADAVSPHGRRMAPVTIYRALDFLIEQGLAHRLASLNAYVASSDTPSHRQDATAFLICEGCGGVNEVSSPELSDAMSMLNRHHAFAPQRRVLELTGRCANC